LARVAGTWAYTMSPVVRVALDLKQILVKDRPTDAPPALPEPTEELADESPDGNGAEYVGVYTAQGYLLVLDAEGGFTLGSRAWNDATQSGNADEQPGLSWHGTFRVARGQLILSRSEGASRYFTPQGDEELRDDGFTGLTFLPVRETTGGEP
jgi:hypothetical protein